MERGNLLFREEKENRICWEADCRPPVLSRRAHKGIPVGSSSEGWCHSCFRLTVTQPPEAKGCLRVCMSARIPVIKKQPAPQKTALPPCLPHPRELAPRLPACCCLATHRILGDLLWWSADAKLFQRIDNLSSWSHGNEVMKGGCQGVGIAALELKDSNLNFRGENVRSRSTDARVQLYKYKFWTRPNRRGEKSANKQTYSSSRGMNCR